MTRLILAAVFTGIFFGAGLTTTCRTRADFNYGDTGLLAELVNKIKWQGDIQLRQAAALERIARALEARPVPQAKPIADQDELRAWSGGEL